MQVGCEWDASDMRLRYRGLTLRFIISVIDCEYHPSGFNGSKPFVVAKFLKKALLFSACCQNTILQLMIVHICDSIYNYTKTIPTYLIVQILSNLCRCWGRGLAVLLVHLRCGV